MRPIVVCLVLLMSVAVQAQAPIVLSADDFGYAGSLCGQQVVRSGNGTLYLFSLNGSVAGTRPIVAYSSTDNGSTWTTFLASGLNDATSGASGQYLSNSLNVAIDDQDRVHLHWGNFYYPSYFNSYYRTLDLTTGTTGPIIDVQAMLGVSTSSRTSACNVAVGPAGTIWLTAASTSYWQSQLLRSDAPYAGSGTFTSVGVVSVTASAQSVRFAVDALGSVHCTYYENTGSGDYRHRMFDDMSGAWSPATDLGDLAPINDNWGLVACDGFGNTHLVCVRNAGSSSNPAGHIVYYRRDAGGTFTGPVSVSNATSAQFGSNNSRIVGLTCDPATGDCFVAYRDFPGGGRLVLESKGLLDTSFSHVTEIRPPNTAQHHYYHPILHGTLWPMTNNFDGNVHMTWRENSPAPYNLMYQRVSTVSANTVTFSPAATVSPGTSVSVHFSAPAHGNTVYVPLISCTLGSWLVPNTQLTLPIVPDFCTNYYLVDPGALYIFILGDPLSPFGTLDGNGQSTGVIALPSWVPAGLNLPLHVSFVTLGPNGPSDVGESGTVVIQ